MIAVWSHRPLCWDLVSNPLVHLVRDASEAAEIDADVWILDRPEGFQLHSWIEQARPKVFLFVDTPLSDLPLSHRMVIAGDGAGLAAERYGSPLIWRGTLHVFYAQEGLQVQHTPLPKPLCGPDVLDEVGRPVFWPTEPFQGLGVRVSRDSTDVLRVMHRAWQGSSPTWIQPGIAAALPKELSTIEGHRGVLCAANDPGGFVVLSLVELCSLVGAPALPDLESLRAWIPAQGADAVLQWAHAMEYRL